jgi:exodeoxyribonuclease III
MKIVSWNVAGLRAMLKKSTFEEYIFGDQGNIDILCLQETKAEEKQVQLSENLIKKYPYCYWNSTKGTTQRKGFSGVSIWCTSQPKNIILDNDWDEEGRILSLDFDKFLLINVYVPNSQKFEVPRYYFRENWNSKFISYINELKSKFPNKEIIICGDMNVAHLDIDICNPKSKKNKVAGFFDNERSDFEKLLKLCNLCDVYRNLNNNVQKSTYWSNFLKAERNIHNGWGIDYFLVSEKLMQSKIIKSCSILMNIKGSDHCPIEILLNN